MLETESKLAAPLFEGDGELRALCRAFDWASTPLGPPERWPVSLRTTVSTLLATSHPMLLFWGPDLIQFYNDAFRPSLGDRHPRALGMRARDFWTDVWHLVGPQIEAVMAEGRAWFFVDQLVPIERHGRMEEVYWTYSYSPALADDGSVGGTLIVCQETTRTVVGTRRMKTLHDLAALPRREHELPSLAALTQLLAAEERDVPFLLCYLTVADEFQLAASARAPAALHAPDNWPLARALESRAVQPVELPDPSLVEGVGPWPEPPRRAVVVPLEHAASGSVLGALVFGISARLDWDEAYEAFARSAARDIAQQVVALRGEAERAALTRALELERSRLEHTFKHAPSFLAVLRGPSFVYELANDAYLELVGNRDIIGKPLVEAIPEVVGQGFVEMLAHVLETGEPFVGRDVPAIVSRRPGSEPEMLYLDLTYIPYVETDGTRSGIIAHGVETTEQVRARGLIERTMRDAERARAEAEAANRSKSEFLAVMSHELRTPLNAISGYVELLEMGVRGPITEQQREDLTRIQASQRHLLGLINEVLNYARLETGSVRYDLEDLSVRAILVEAELLVRPQMAAKSLALTVAECDPALVVRADQEKTRQIVVNLLSNAMKFTERGGRIELRCEARENLVAIIVSDTGMGIPADKLEAIFEPFVQVRPSLTRGHDGVGLGLAISRDLARGMGGDLYAESELGKGSVFTLVLQNALA